MQRTRLNILFDATFRRFSSFFQNPWRRIALIIICLLFGNFMATVFPPAIGQTLLWDSLVALGILTFSELVSWLYYSNRQKFPQTAPQNKFQSRTSLLLDMLNVFKIGFIYGIFVSGLMPGS